MRVLFRTDASVQIGTGHVMRCLTLADALRERGAECLFICREHKGHLLEVIRQRGFDVYGLPIATESVERTDSRRSEDPHQSAWLGSDWWAIDAAQTKVGAGGTVVDWLIVDHYGLDARWENLVRGCSRCLMVIDDIANRPHSCNLLLDQNYEDPSRYQALVPPYCKLLLGPAYALLRPEYAANRGPEALRRHPLRRVLVFFGGSDPADLTGKTVRALMAPALLHLKVDVVVGGSYSHHESLRLLAKEHGQTTIHGPQPHLADLMMAADLAVGAGGVTNWERMTLGLPSLVITLAENQVPISGQLHRRGIIRLVGTSENVSVEHIRDALLDEIWSNKYLNRIAPSMALCDGQGTGRVLNAMQLIREQKLR